MSELVSVILCAYNHEKFAEEAVRSVFAQTHRPLELIICDDASKDATSAVLDRVLVDLPPGIILHRVNHATNQGLARSLNDAVALATARVLLLAAADDVMEPERVALTLKEFTNPRVRFVHTAIEKISEDGSGLGENRQECAGSIPLMLTGHLTAKEPPVVGASCAYHRDVFSVFGPLDPVICQEDVVLPLRGLLLGEGRFLGQVLVGYRIHSGNLHSIAGPQSSQQLVRRVINHMPSRAAICRQLAHDALVIQGMGIPVPPEFSRYLSGSTAYSETELALSASTSRLARALKIFQALCRERLPFRSAVKLSALFIFPGMYAFLLKLRIKLREARAS